jgi:transcriptional regulator with XRE-family HTH domain
MSPVAPCRLFRLKPFPAVLFGVRAAELRPVPPSSAWFVCKWFAPRQAERQEEGLTISPSLISQIERGRSKPSVSTLYAIVTELGISLDRLFGGAEDHVGHSSSPGELSEEASSGQPVVHPDQRHVIELESGVRWERLTSGHNDKVDFLYVVYDIDGLVD